MGVQAGSNLPAVAFVTTYRSRPLQNVDDRIGEYCCRIRDPENEHHFHLLFRCKKHFGEFIAVTNIHNPHGLCCTNPMRDSSCESSVVAERYV